MRSKKKKKKFKAICMVMITFILILKSGQAIGENINNKSTNTHSSLQYQIYNFLKDKGNRIKVYNRAAELNNGSTQNTCVYFVSEVLRENGMDIPNSTSNTSQLIPLLKKQGWVKSRDYKKLKYGDICFTTDSYLDKDVAPNHTYIFMGWVDEGKYDFAYVCDNQAKDYEGKIYHIRNINVEAKVKGENKDPFGFFMYKGKRIIG